MPKDSNGIYTLPPSNPVQPNTEISTLWANPTMEDIAVALTGDLPRNGTAAMFGPLKLPDGTVGVPSLAFSANSTTGLFRENTEPALGVTVNGVKRLSVSPVGTVASYKVETDALLSANVITLGVDTAVGVAVPVNPIAGNPFLTLAAAIAYANKITSAYNVVLQLTAGQTFSLSATTEVTNENVSIKSSVSGTRVNIVGTGAVRSFYLNGKIIFTDVAFNDILLTNNSSNYDLTTTNCTITGTGLLAANEPVIRLYGGKADFGNLTLTKGSMYLYNGVNAIAIDLTISAGFLLVQYYSQLTISGDIRVTASGSGQSAVVVNFYSFLLIASGIASFTAAAALVVTVTQFSTLYIGNGTNAVSFVCNNGTASSHGCIYQYRSCGVYVNCTTLTMTAAAPGVGVSSTTNNWIALFFTTFTHTANIPLNIGILTMGRISAAIGNAVLTPLLNVDGTSFNKWTN